MSQLNFDASQVDPQQSFDPIPAAWYKTMIVASEMKPTKDQQGAYLQLQLKVIDGEYTNRVVFARLNVQNRSQVAQEIAYKQLSAICHAVNVIQVQDSQQLHGIPFETKVSVSPASDGYDASNDVKGFRKIGAGNQNTQQQNTGFMQQNTAQVNNNEPEFKQQNMQQNNFQQNTTQVTEQNNSVAEKTQGGDVPPWMQNQQ